MPTTQPVVSTVRASTVTTHIGDALRVLRALPSNSIDAVVCDPPYAIRAVKDPGADHRSTASRLVCVLCENAQATAGFDICNTCLDELRIATFTDAAMLGQQSANWHEKATHSRGYADNDNAAFGLWVTLWAAECLRLLRPGGHLVAFGGTRTWHRLACAVEDVGFEVRDSLAWLYATGVPKSLDVGRAVGRATGTGERAGARGAARQRPTQAERARPLDEPEGWAGWYTGVKPAHEPIVLARKPVIGTVAENVLCYGTGALNVGGTRLDGDRWPSNVLLDAEQSERLDRELEGRGSRFFFVAKPSPRERVTVGDVAHPTVKPLSLMRELVRLVTPSGGVVLDPFAGSGTTVEACVIEGRDCLAIERETGYLPLIQARVKRQAVAGTSRGPGPESQASPALPGNQDAAQPPRQAEADPDTLF